MNGTGLTTGSVAGSGAGGVGRIMGTRLVSTINWRRFGQSDRGRFDEKVLGGWIRGKNVEAFSKDLFESVKARIISSGDGKMMGVMGGLGE